MGTGILPLLHIVSAQSSSTLFFVFLFIFSPFCDVVWRNEASNPLPTTSFGANSTIFWVRFVNADVMCIDFSESPVTYHLSAFLCGIGGCRQDTFQCIIRNYWSGSTNNNYAWSEVHQGLPRLLRCRASILKSSAIPPNVIGFHARHKDVLHGYRYDENRFTKKEEKKAYFN